MDWKQYLSVHLKEELMDSAKYADLAHQTSGVTSQMFWDMAEEEYEHACAAWHMMEHEGLTKGMDKHATFSDAKKALHKY